MEQSDAVSKGHNLGDWYQIRNLQKTVDGIVLQMHNQLKDGGGFEVYTCLTA